MDLGGNHRKVLLPALNVKGCFRRKSSTLDRECRREFSLLPLQNCALALVHLITLEKAYDAHDPDMRLKRRGVMIVNEVVVDGRNLRALALWSFFT
jgi:hypothetical protein